MERRELLKQIAILTGGAFIGGELFLTGCKSGAKLEAGFTPATISLLDEVGETIIPATKTPGAKAAQVGELMKTIVTDCYTQNEQTAFTKGIVQLDDACNKMHGKGFMECDAKQRHDLLVSLEKEAKTFDETVNKENEGKKDDDQVALAYALIAKAKTCTQPFGSGSGIAAPEPTTQEDHQENLVEHRPHPGDEHTFEAI